MKAIILAAGKGRRLASSGWDKPKCLLRLANGTLLDNLLLSLVENEVREAAIVVGYKQELVREAAEAHPLDFTYFENPDYVETNTINSLWRAAEYADDDILYFNADVLFDRRIVTKLIEQTDSTLAVEKKRCGQEDVKVVVDSAGRVLEIGKRLDPKLCAGEFTGIGLFRKKVWPDFKEALSYYNEVVGQRDLFFEAALDKICNKHVILALDVSAFDVIEIDTPADLRAAESIARGMSKEE